MKDQILMAAKMYKCQSAAKQLFKLEYPEKIKTYKEILRAVMLKEKISELKAVLLVTEAEEIKQNGLALMLFVSAAVDLIEQPNRNNREY